MSELYWFWLYGWGEEPALPIPPKQTRLGEYKQPSSPVRERFHNLGDVRLG